MGKSTRQWGLGAGHGVSGTGQCTMNIGHRHRITGNGEHVRWARLNCGLRFVGVWYAHAESKVGLTRSRGGLERRGLVEAASGRVATRHERTGDVAFSAQSTNECSSCPPDSIGTTAKVRNPCQRSPATPVTSSGRTCPHGPGCYDRNAAPGSAKAVSSEVAHNVSFAGRTRRRHSPGAVRTRLRQESERWRRRKQSSSMMPRSMPH